MSGTEQDLIAWSIAYDRDFNGLCQAFVWRICERFGTVPREYLSAKLAYQASKIESKDPKAAPVGAVHYWNLPSSNYHVAVGLGGSRVIMASSHAGQQIGDKSHHIIITTVEAYATGSYMGWSLKNGENTTGIIAPPLNGDQRRVAGVEVIRREQPSSKANDLGDGLAPGTVGNFNGWIHGENVSGNDVWFRGISGAWFWSGAFEDKGTHDLTDLNPKPATLATGQRKAATNVIRRETPSTAGKDLGNDFSAGEVGDFIGWAHGQSVENNDIWFRGISGSWFWSGAFEDTSTNGLPEIKLEQPSTPVTPSEPAPSSPTPPYTFLKDLPCVTGVIPTVWGNFELGHDGKSLEFPDQPKKVVIHQFGTPDVDTYSSTLSWFQDPKAETSAHFVVSGKHIVQMVSLQDRAYHAGPGGNDFVGIESDPHQDPETVASVQLLLSQLDEHYGYTLERIRHRDVAQTSCGALIDIEKNYLPKPPEPEPAPEPEPEPTPEPSSPVDIVDALKDIQSAIGKIIDLLDNRVN